MPSFQVREEVLNVQLAELLQERGLLSIPETIRRAVASRGRRLPDITIADLWGTRITLEGRFVGGPRIRDGLIVDAQRRVAEGISPICLAVLYPGGLRHTSSLPALKRALAKSLMDVRIVSEGDDGSWNEASIDGIVDILRHSYELLVSEDIVVNAVEHLTDAIDTATQIIASSSGSPPRLRDLLGIPDETDLDADDDGGRE